MIISSWSAPSTTVTSWDASAPTPAKTSRYILATRAGVSRRPPRSGSSPIPSRIKRTPDSTFSSSKRSSSIAPQMLREHGRNQRVEGVGELDEVRKLAGARQHTRLASPVDPHSRQAESGAWLDVVEQGGCHVRVPLAVGPGQREERLPM